MRNTKHRKNDVAMAEINEEGLANLFKGINRATQVEKRIWRPLYTIIGYQDFIKTASN